MDTAHCPLAGWLGASAGLSSAAIDQENVSRVAFHTCDKILATTNAAGELRFLDARSGVTLQVMRTQYGQRGLDLPFAAVTEKVQR